MTDEVYEKVNKFEAMRLSDEPGVSGKKAIAARENWLDDFPPDMANQLRENSSAMQAFYHGYMIAVGVWEKPPNVQAQAAALIAWLQAEMDEDELAKINARDHGEWDRYHRLEGHRSGLLHVLHHLRAEHWNAAMRNG